MPTPLEGFMGFDGDDDLLKAVSRLPPEKILGYLIATSRMALSLYARMRDTLPQGYGRLKFSRFVDVKVKQVTEMCSVALRLFPQAVSTDEKPGDMSFSVETVGDYVGILSEAIRLERLQMNACKYLSERVESRDMKAILEDMAAEMEANIKALEEELERARRFESKDRFSEFVKDLMGGSDG